MADPLRRTILAKLRGKKSKKGSAVAGFSLSANGGGEGKDELLPKRKEQKQRAIIIPELSDMPDTMWGEASVFYGGFNNSDMGLVRENTMISNEVSQYGAFMDISFRLGNDRAGENLGVNEELLGVRDQRQTSARESVKNAVGFNRQELHFAGQVRPDCFGSRGQNQHAVPVRKYSLGDCIGFGTCENYTENGKTVRADVKVTGRDETFSKNKSCEDDLQIPCQGRGFIDAFVVRNNAGMRTNDANNETQTYRFQAPGVYQFDRDKVEEHILIRNIESYGSSPEPTGENKISFQNTAFFPTELQICDGNDRPQCVRDGAQRHSLDSEDDDYYDNENLPFYESESQNIEINDGRSSGHFEVRNCGSALETDRLTIQLKEAYNLLINAMQDIRFDCPVVVNGFAGQTSASSHSQDSVCSQSSAKVIDSDAWSSGKNSPQQLSDTDSLILNSIKTHEPCFKISLISKSYDNLSATEARPLLQRSLSDGAIEYPVSLSCTKSLASQICVIHDCEELASTMDGHEEKSICHGISSNDLMENGSDGLLNESNGSNNSLTGSSDCVETQGCRRDLNRAQGVSAKPHGVTVNKMQEWMHKGRMLSSEMRQRLSGSSPCVHGASSPQSGPGFSNRTKSSTQTTSMQGRKRVPQQSAFITSVDFGVDTASSARPQMFSSSHISSARKPYPQNCAGKMHQRSATSLIENVHNSVTATVEVRTGRPNEPPLNTITVSKKRNWLQQSSVKSLSAEGSALLEEDVARGAKSASTLSEAHKTNLTAPSLGLCKQPCPQPAHTTVSQDESTPQPGYVDPAEENDADDEGEIWYNPIPEDEELDLPCDPAVRPQAPPGSDPQVPRGTPSAGDGGRIREPSPTSPEGTDECQGGPRSEAGHANAVHSSEPAQLHRQMFVCKASEGRPTPRAAALDTIEGSSSGFSPPSSPNPTKKGGSINWSFPEKIKSPRTVRKLSIRMRKLPELSRKLSVKGASTVNQAEPRPLGPKLNHGVDPSQCPPCRPSRGGQTAASRNVISRYHLDSSVSTQNNYKKKSSQGSKSASKGGYLSDGDSPELVAKSGKHGWEGKGGKSKEPPASGISKPHGSELDIDAFRHYSFVDQPKCSQYISGLMNLHFYGAEDLKPPRMDSREVFCAIQVDCVNKARTALLTCRTTFLDMDHTFNIELENAQHLKLVVFSWEPTPRRNRACCHGTVVLPTLFRVSKAHQLAVKLEPRGIIYVKLNLMEQWKNSLDGPDDGDHESQVFGVEVWKVVERENVGLMLPVLIDKCITEIEKRGCQVVGLYRLCGSAAVKKELREAFERDSRLVELSENLYPDVNVITGVLKDYLRELPYPLISKNLYEAVLDSMAKRPLRIGANGNENDHADSEHTVGLLEILPEVEKATLRRLLDHLKLVASHHEVNKMTCQNLAVCFGPVLLSQRQEASSHSKRVFIDSEELASALHFKKHIEVLHYLLQLWPVMDSQSAAACPVKEPPAEVAVAPQYLRRRRERPQVLNVSEEEIAGVLRPKPGRLDSPSNRYAGDWSRCGESYLQPLKAPVSEEVDYDDVPSEDMEDTGDQQEKPEQAPPAEEEKGGRQGEEEGEDSSSVDVRAHVPTGPVFTTQQHLVKEHRYQAFVKIQNFTPVLSNRVNLKDLQESIDTLIGNLERELNKNRISVG